MVDLKGLGDVRIAAMKNEEMKVVSIADDGVWRLGSAAVRQSFNGRVDGRKKSAHSRYGRGGAEVGIESFPSGKKGRRRKA